MLKSVPQEVFQLGQYFVPYLNAGIINVSLEIGPLSDKKCFTVLSTSI